jgi:hypothetical protein
MMDISYPEEKISYRDATSSHQDSFEVKLLNKKMDKAERPK